MKIKIMSLAIALAALMPMAYAVNSANSDVESIFLNAADESSDTEGMPVELDDVDLPRAVKKALPANTIAQTSKPANMTAQLNEKTGVDKQTQQNIGELRKQNQDLQTHLNQLNQQMAMLRQAIDQSNKMFVASMAAQNQNAAVKFKPKTQLQPASLIVEPTPSLVSALQTHPKITGVKASAKPPAIKDEKADVPAADQALNLNLSENDVINGKSEQISVKHSAEPATDPRLEKAGSKGEHILSMGDLLKETHLSNKLPASAEKHSSLISPEQFDEGSASLIAATKKIANHLTRLGLRYLPDDPNVALKLSAGVFAMLFALMILAAWPTRKKMQKKEQKKLRKQEQIQLQKQRRIELKQKAEERKLQARQEKELRILRSNQAKEQREQKRLELQMQKELELQRLKQEAELQRLKDQEQQEQLRAAKLAEQARQQEALSKGEAEIKLKPAMPVSEITNSVTSEEGMRTIYNIATDSKESIPVKLNLARSCLEKGDYEGVKQALRPVLIKGNKIQREEARIILEEAMTVLEQEG